MTNKYEIKDILRILLICFYIFLLLKYVNSVEYQSIFGAINLGIHEIGHVVFAFLGDFIGVLGGTLMQLLAPVFTIVIFYRQREYFGISFALVWLATNLFNVAVYIADANLLALPLVSLGAGHTIHDWNYILDRMGLLAEANTIALVVEGLGFTFLLLGIIWALAYVGKKFVN